MKRTQTIALSLAAVLSCGTTALAQDHAVQATVPFDFTVGTSLLPAGTYTITPVSDGVISIRDRDKHVAILSEANADGNRAKRGELVFDKYADQYFLREVLCESSAMNIALPVTKAEKRARKQETENASMPNVTEVLVAAK